MKHLIDYIKEALDEDLIRELFLYGTNHRPYYDKYEKPMVDNLIKKGKKDPGCLNVDLLASSSVMQKHIKFITDEYSREFGKVEIKGADRKELARRLAEYLINSANDELGL